MIPPFECEYRMEGVGTSARKAAIFFILPFRYVGNRKASGTYSVATGLVLSASRLESLAWCDARVDRLRRTDNNLLAIYLLLAVHCLPRQSILAQNGCCLSDRRRTSSKMTLTDGDTKSSNSPRPPSTIFWSKSTKSGDSHNVAPEPLFEGPTKKVFG